MESSKRHAVALALVCRRRKERFEADLSFSFNKCPNANAKCPAACVLSADQPGVLHAGGCCALVQALQPEASHRGQSRKGENSFYVFCIL